jgi:predicted transcriptional regulator YdeE
VANGFFETLYGNFKMILEQPILKYVDGFVVKGFSVRTKNSMEFDKNTAKLPQLWQKFISNHPAVDDSVFGVYSDYESDVNGFYTVTAGIASEHEDTGTHTVKVISGNYLIFKAKGEQPEAVINAWQNVWNYFTNKNLYKRRFMTDFECYGKDDEVAVYIAVE